MLLPAAAMPQDLATGRAALPRVARCSDASLCTLLEQALHSQTVRALVARIEDLHGLVYVAWTPRLPPGVEAAVMERLQTTPDGMKCLWIVIHRRSRGSTALIPVLAHELQHAVEVLESGALTSAEIEAYFRRRAASGGRVHETDAARRVQQRVERELQSR